MGHDTAAPAGPDQATPATPPRAYRRWTQRMAGALGLSRRRIQKLIEDGAPDHPDDTVNAAWQAHESAWRHWLLSHPRWRKLGRRLKAPVALDHAAAAPTPGPEKTAGNGAAGGDERALLSLLEQEKLAKAKADRMRAELQLRRETGDVVPRDQALRAITDALLAIQAAIDDFAPRLAQDLPLEMRDHVRSAGRALADKEKARLVSALRRSWQSAVPPKEYP